MLFLRVNLILIVLLCGGMNALACTCLTESSPCASFKGTPVVFAGLVTSIKEEKVTGQRFGREVTVRVGLVARFNVEEPLKGITTKTVEVATGGGGGDCGYPFKEGKRYLVYAYRNGGDALSSAVSRTVTGGGSRTTAELSATICSRTSPLESASDDVELIRALTRGKPEMRIFGRVEEFVEKLSINQYDLERVGGMPGVTVTAESKSGKYEVKTDSEGHFAIRLLRPGNYVVGVTLPEGYGPLFDFRGTRSGESVTRANCGWEINFDAQIDGRIGGRVFDAEGKPVPDQVQVSVVPIESSTKGIALRPSRSDSTENGGYLFAGLPPGSYLIGVNIAGAPDRHSPYAAFYYPNTTNPTQARVFTLAAGQKFKNIDFHLPPQLPETTLTGVVLDGDGRPVVEARVNLYDQEDPRRSLFSSSNIKTDNQGRFSLKFLAGRRYWVHAWKADDYMAGTGQQSELLKLAGDSAAGPIKLILNKPGVFIPKTPEPRP